MTLKKAKDLPPFVVDLAGVRIECQTVEAALDLRDALTARRHQPPAAEEISVGDDDCPVLPDVPSQSELHQAQQVLGLLVEDTRMRTEPLVQVLGSKAITQGLQEVRTTLEQLGFDPARVLERSLKGFVRGPQFEPALAQVESRLGVTPSITRIPDTGEPSLRRLRQLQQVLRLMLGHAHVRLELFLRCLTQWVSDRGWRKYGRPFAGWASTSPRF